MPLRLIMTLLLVSVSAPVVAREYCAGLDEKRRLECWNGQTDKKEAALAREIARSKRGAKKNGKSYGLDVSVALRLMDKSQAAWNIYVEQECSLEREAVGSGTDRNPQEMNCYLTKLDERIAEIRKNWPR